MTFPIREIRFILILLILPCEIVFSQNCNFIVNAGNDTTLCSPAILQLQGSTTAHPDSIRSVSWQPSTSFSNPDILNPVLNVTGSGQYILNVSAVTGNNAIINGDFSLGDSGFTTSYVQGTGGVWGILSNEGEYDISTDPALSHNSFDSFGDHTTGSGNMLVINGADVPTPIWCQTINVVPNTNYDFSAWMATCYSLNPSVLQFSINGNLLGSPFVLSSNTGVWEQFSAVWNSGTNTSANICIVNQSTAIGGNDFALDDIVFSEICTASDTVNITLINPGTFSLGNDTTICGDSIILDAAISGNASYLWNTGETNQSITVSDTGIYSVQVIVNASCILTDTIIISGGDLQISLGNDTTLCSGQQLVLTVNNPPGTTVLWNTGETIPSIVTDNPGIYSVMVQNGNCIATDTIVVEAGPELHAGNDTLLCNGQQVLLDATIPNASSFLWDNGSAGPTVIADSPGSYIVTVSADGCIVTDTVNISFVTGQPDLGPDTSLCGNIILDATYPGAVSYSWNTGETSPVITISQSGLQIVSVTINSGCILYDSVNVTINNISVDIDSAVAELAQGESITINIAATGIPPYTYLWSDPDAISCDTCIQTNITSQGTTQYYYVTVTDALGCEGTDSILIINPECDTELFFPNAFTPNNDGKNDFYFVSVTCPGTFSFAIYNRWGENIFESADPYFRWNGKNKGTGQDSPEGTYYYISTSGTKKYHGHVTLIR